jgi:hypothetical protein
LFFFKISKQAMAFRGGGLTRSRTALVLLLLVLLSPLLATPPCAHARELLGSERTAGDAKDGEREAATGWTMVRGPPAFGGAGRRTTSGLSTAAVAVAARVLGSVPSPGVGH